MLADSDGRKFAQLDFLPAPLARPLPRSRNKHVRCVSGIVARFAFCQEHSLSADWIFQRILKGLRKPHFFKKRACIALRKFVTRQDLYDLNLTFPQVCRFVVRRVPAVGVFVCRVLSAAKPTTAYKEPEGADGAGAKRRECRKSAFRSHQGERRRRGNANAVR